MFLALPRAAESAGRSIAARIAIIADLNAFVKVGIASPHPVKISALQEETVCDYLNWLIRELLLNAIIHRDYQIGNAPVKFYEYNNRIEISNPGGLYGQATPENFPYVNDYRNPLWAEAMKIMGYVNKFNCGIAKVKNELERNGNPLPVFDYNKRTEFRVTLCPANGEINGEITTSNGEIKPEVGEINGEMKILEAITENPGIKRDRLRSITGISLRTIDRIVKRLTNDEKIEYRSSKRTGGWYVRT